MGEIRIGHLSRCMINGDFGHFRLPLAVGFSSGHFDLEEALRAMEAACLVPFGSDERNGFSAKNFQFGLTQDDGGA